MMENYTLSKVWLGGKSITVVNFKKAKWIEVNSLFRAIGVTALQAMSNLKHSPVFSIVDRNFFVASFVDGNILQLVPPSIAFLIIKNEMVCGNPQVKQVVDKLLLKELNCLKPKRNKLLWNF